MLVLIVKALKANNSSEASRAASFELSSLRLKRCGRPVDNRSLHVAIEPQIIPPWLWVTKHATIHRSVRFASEASNSGLMKIASPPPTTEFLR